jgi:flap endonuclease-1
MTHDKFIVSTTKPYTMGIRGLHICIKKTCPLAVPTVKWADWTGCRIGIDIQCFLYRALSRGESPLEAIASQIVFFKNAGINIIYIFDGKPPKEKDVVNDKRSLDRRQAIDKCGDLKAALAKELDAEKRVALEAEIRTLESRFPSLTYEMKDEIKKFLYASGTMFICANCEADTLLAYWYRRGVIDAVASHDYDFVARGCRLLAPATGRQLDQYEDYNPEKIWRALRLSEAQFVDMCVLLGSDYTPGLPIVPWKSALTAFQHGDTMEMIWARHTFSNWRQVNMKEKLMADILILNKARRILCGDDDIPETMMEDIQWTKWSAGQQKAEPQALTEFKKTYSDWNQAWWSVLTA